MRIGFGILSLLVTMGLLALIMYKIELPEAEAGHDVQLQVQQIAGKDQNGVPVEATYKLTVETRPDGKIKDLLVASIEPGSPVESYFGLKVNDVITAAIGQGGFQTDMSGATDEDTARLAVRDAYALHGKLIVQRAGQKLELPVGGHGSAADMMNKIQSQLQGAQ